MFKIPRKLKKKLYGTRGRRTTLYFKIRRELTSGQLNILENLTLCKWIQIYKQTGEFPGLKDGYINGGTDPYEIQP